MSTFSSHLGDATAPELVSVGRISVDLYGEQLGQDLRTAVSFRRYIGGSAGNIAVGSSRLGVRTAMMARIGADGFGDYLVDELHREAVSTTGIVRDPERSTGTIVLAMHEASDFPRSFLVQDPAEFNLSADDIDEAIIRSAGAVVLTGSLLSRPNLAAASERVLDAAREGNTQIIFDIDYRPAFWGVVPRTQGQNLSAVTPEVTQRLQTVIADCDVIIGTEAEICALGGSEDVLASLRHIRTLSRAIIVFKAGPEGCYAFENEITDSLADAVYSPGFSVDVVNSVGAGDGFMSGFLRGYLRGESLATALRWANASGAIVVGRLACSGDSPSKAELDEFIARAESRAAAAPAPSSKSELQFDTVTRHRARKELLIFAIDHRGHLERVADDAGVGPEAIAAFKSLAITAFLDAHAEDPSAGLLLDDVYVGSALRERIADSGVWSARALELSGRAPVQFGGNGDVAGFLQSWPREQVVKVLMVASPGEDPVIRFENQQRLASLARVCRNQGRDLLVEILPAPGHSNAAGDYVDILSAWYDAGIKPAWWKLPALATPEDWRLIDELVAQRDPGCRGILVLGGGTSNASLEANFKATAATSLVKGFALGRPIFHEVASQWMRGELDDASAGAQIVERYRAAVALWSARA